jgi:hypothetical protein
MIFGQICIDVRTTESLHDYNLKADVPSEQDTICLYYINEHNVETCPKIKILIENQQCRALIDTGCQCPIVAVELYNDFKAGGLDSLELPTQNFVWESAFTVRTKRVKRQTVIQLQIDNILIDQIFLISSQLVTPLLLGVDFCMDNLVIDFPKKTIIINADEESATEVAMVNERRNIYNGIDSPVTRAIDLRTTDLPPTPQLHRTVNPSISDTSTLLYNARLPDKGMFPNQITVEEASFCNEVYDLSSEDAEEVNNQGQARGPFSPNRYKGMNSAIAEGKYEHADTNVIR